MELFKNIRLNSGRSLLRKRSESVKRSGRNFLFTKVESIGILWDATNESGYQTISAFNKKMAEAGKRVEVLAWIPGKEVSNQLTGLSYMRFLKTDDLNFNFIPSSTDSKFFIERKFDLLIDINPAKVFPLTYIATLSISPMKVGIGTGSDSGDEPYDLMIQSGKENDIEAFLDQTVHYLTLINSHNQG